jgi:hypothetical protein
MRGVGKEMAPQEWTLPGTRPTGRMATVDTRSIHTPTSEVPLPEKPKTAVCSGCGGKYPHPELIELHEDNHDDLTYFHGDSLCRSCANDAGVDY